MNLRGNIVLKRIRTSDFLKKTLKISIPVMLQTFLMSSLNLIDMLMVGQLGATSVAAIGLANQMYFILSYILIGLSGGAAIFTSQYWGKKELSNINIILNVSTKLSLIICLIFTVIAVFLPKTVMGIYSKDILVIKEGAMYLAIVGLSYLFTALTFNYSAILRCIGKVKIPMYVSFFALTLNSFLNYVFIFGKFNFPVLGFKGIAIATTVSRVIECVLLILVINFSKLPVSFRFTKIKDIKIRKKYIKTTIPLILNVVSWTIGISIYNMVYARIGTESVAAVNIAGTIERMAFVIFAGLASACNILIGHNIGANNDSLAYTYAKRFIILGFFTAIIIGAFIFGISYNITPLFNVSGITLAYSQIILKVMAFVLWIKVVNMIIIQGILRGGGDTKYSFVQNATAIWIFGIPTALIASFIFKLPIYWIIILITIEEVVKLISGLSRVISRKWINNVT